MTATEVDPFFFLLAALESIGGSRLCPLQQCLSCYPGGDCSVLLGVKGLESRLSAVAEVREGLSPGFANVLVRLDRERALDTLSNKALVVAQSMCAEAEASKTRARAAMAGTFNVSTTVASSPLDSSPGGSVQATPLEPQVVHFEEAVGLLSLYLSDEWVVALRERVAK